MMDGVIFLYFSLKRKRTGCIMNLKHLSYFVDISKRESFTKAADDIYVSQSALSKSVKSLEQELNVTLIDRTSKSFNLTEEGRILYAEGEKLLRYIDESQDEIIEKIHRSRRRLRIFQLFISAIFYFALSNSILILNWKSRKLVRILSRTR